MQVRIGVLAEYASISEGNKLNILGIFTFIKATNVPAIHGQMVLVVQLEFDPSEAGNKNIKTVLRDEDGREILSFINDVQIDRSPDGSPALYNQILQLNNLPFLRFGDYEFVVLVNDRLETEIPLKVIRIEPPTVQE